MKRLTIIVLSMLLLVSASRAQQRSNPDFETWTSAMFRYQYNRALQANLEQQVRFRENSSAFDRTFTEVELRYNPKPEERFRWAQPFRFAVGARRITLQDGFGGEQGRENHFRLHLDFGIAIPVKRVRFELRQRWQTRNELGRTEAQFDFPARDHRTRISVGYNIRNWKLDPEVAYEAFIHRETGELDGYTKYRLSISTRWKINDQHSIGLRYMREKETVIWNPQVTRVLALRYRYRIKRSGRVIYDRD